MDVYTLKRSGVLSLSVLGVSLNRGSKAEGKKNIPQIVGCPDVIGTQKFPIEENDFLYRFIESVGKIPTYLRINHSADFYLFV